MKKLFTTLAVVVMFIAVVSCSAKEADTACKSSLMPEVKVLKTVYAESFDVSQGDPKSRGWSFWSPAGQTLDTYHDKEYGRKAAGSLCVASGKRAYWQKKINIQAGGIYKFSAWVKASAGTNQIGITTQPVDENNNFITAYAVKNLQYIKADCWQRFEVIWFAPQSGSYGQKKISKLDIELIGRSVEDKVWFDDVKLEKIEIISPLYDGFKPSGSKWDMSIRQGNEGGGEVKHLPSGFADAGAIEVKHTYGTPGIAAARVFPLAADTAGDYLTFSVFVKSADKAETAISVQQLDGDDNIINENSGKPTPTADWENRRLTVKVNEKTVNLKIMLFNNSKNVSAVFDNLLARPARADEIFSVKEKFPVKVGISPADVIASIDKSEPKITVLSGQASAIGIHLAGENRKDSTTTVDVEVPSWLKLLTAQQAVYGTEPLEWKQIELKEKQRTVYRFINPYPWQSWSTEYKFNPYTNLLLVFRAETQAGAQDSITIKTKLDKDKGQTRELKISVLEPLSPLPQQLKEFKIGTWSMLWLNVIDDDARDELIGAYANAGFNLGQARPSHSYANKTFKKYNFDVYASIVHDPSSAVCYKSFPEIQKNSMVTVDGKPYKYHIAIGMALGDKATHDAYEKYLKRELTNFPDDGEYIFNDMEYWGLGQATKACFHPSTIAAFRKYAKFDKGLELTPEIILKDYYPQWSKFRIWAGGQMHKIQREFLKEHNPGLLLAAYDYPLATGGKDQSFVKTVPTSTLTADEYVDVHIVSTYNREGIGFIESLENTVPYLKKPVWIIPYLMDNISSINNDSYNYWPISAEEYKFQIVASAACGAKGINGYPGYVLDAEYLHMSREAVNDIVAYKQFYFEGQLQDDLIVLIDSDKRTHAKVHTYGKQALITLFSAASEPIEIRYKFKNKLNNTVVEPRSYKQIIVDK